MLIDLRSDTTTKPSKKMLSAMANGDSEDDSFGESKSTIMLEEFCADYLKKEAALFFPSGIMANQVALRCLTRPGDEVLLERCYHYNVYESAPSTTFGRIVLTPIDTKDGFIHISDIETAQEAKYRSPLYSEIKLICLENTINGLAGKSVPLEIFSTLFDYSKKNKINVYLDGARILNASIANNVPVDNYAAFTDMMMLSFSKGLGAPFGAILAGTRAHINKARTYRKWFGGGLHQSGYMAFAALYAIQHNVQRLAEDHENAKDLADSLRHSLSEEIVQYPGTNIIMLNCSQYGGAAKIADALKKLGILVYVWNKNYIRCVTHMDINKKHIHSAFKAIISVLNIVSKL